MVLGLRFPVGLKPWRGIGNQQRARDLVDLFNFEREHDVKILAPIGYNNGISNFNVWVPELKGADLSGIGYGWQGLTKGQKGSLFSKQVPGLLSLNEKVRDAKVMTLLKELDDSFAEIRNQIRCFFSEFLPCWTKDGYGLAKNSQGVETEQFGSIDLVDGRTVPKDSFDLDLGVGFGGTFLRLTGVSFNF